MTELEVLNEAKRLLASGDPFASERMLATLWADTSHAPAPALYLLGMIRKAQGRLNDAERYLRRAIAMAPEVRDFHLTLAEMLAGAGFPSAAADVYAAASSLTAFDVEVHRRHVRALLDAMRWEEAEQRAREFLASAPSAEAWIVLANVLRASEKFEAALNASEEALRLNGGSAAAKHGRGVALARLGRNDEALAVFDDLLQRGVRDPALYVHRGAALMNLARAGEAEDMFERGVQQWPGDQNLQHALATTRWMRGGGESFALAYEAAVASKPDAIGLRAGCADLLRRADQRERAERLLREGLVRAPKDPTLSQALAVLLDEMDRSGEALPLLEAGLAARPESLVMRGAYVNALLRLGRGDEALAAVQAARAAEPVNQEWICYETMALRQLGDPRYHELCDYDVMVQAFELPVPPGFSNIVAFNEALRERLLRLHVLETHPLDQSLRHGSQTCQLRRSRAA